MEALQPNQSDMKQAEAMAKKAIYYSGIKTSNNN